MNTKHIFRLLSAVLILLLAGCGAGKSPEPAETGGEPLDITEFSFRYTTSLATDCFRLDLTREEDGIHLYAEELFAGGRIADAVIGNEALELLEEAAGTYRVDRWNGFDKSKSHVMDGSRFSLRLTLTDGTTVSADGNNVFPKNYSEMFAVIRPLYRELLEQYAPAENEPEDSTADAAATVEETQKEDDAS